MKNNRIILTCVAASVMALPLCLSGCDREVSHTSKTTVSDDGTVKSKEKTVTESPNGTVTKEETQKTNSPNP